MRRLAVLAGMVVLLAGVAGIVRGAISTTSSTPAAASDAGPIVATNADVRIQSSTAATATMTVYNTTGTADAVTSVQTGAGGAAQLSGPSIVVPPRGSVPLRVGIGQLYGPLRVGQYVNIQLTMRLAGTVLVTARVVASTASSGSVTPSAPSGVHS